MAAAGVRAKGPAAATDHTVPVLSSASQNATDVTMTGTGEEEEEEEQEEGKGETQAQSSIPSKRKTTAPEAVEEQSHTKTPSSKKKNKSPGARFTLRNPQWAYLHLELVTQPTSITPSPVSQPPLDNITTRSFLTSALSQFLGLSGTSIPIDILKIDNADSKHPPKTPAALVWIRVPHDDLAAVTAALSSWIGGGSGGGVGSGSVAFKVRSRGSWLGALVGGKGEDLFL